MTKYLSHFVNGIFLQGSSAEYGNVTDPATGAIIARVYYANSEDVDSAVQAAQTAFSAWSDTPPALRAKVLNKWRYLIELNQTELATIISQEHGKPINEALGSIARGLDVLEFACGIANHLKGEYSANVSSQVDTFSNRQPLGVVAAITPFNFPAMIPLWTASVAMACGNTVILKPSERNPSCALRLAELALEAGMPKGVLNVVNGAHETVNALLSHPDIKAISFVGQTKTAEYVTTEAIKHGKRVQAFGGAKNHALIMPDCDLTQTVDAVLGAAYGSAGERCMAISVVVAVGDALADKFIEKLVPKVRDLKIGGYTDSSTELCPLISAEHLKRVNDFIESGVKEGATLILDGRQIPVPNEGYFIGGSIFDNVTANMSIYKQEIFGPVLCIVRVKSYEEGLTLINQHEYGNGAAIFTHDGDCARDFSQRVDVGMVGVNVAIPVPVGYHSFGGWKRSNLADHGMHGMEGVRFYTKLKTVTSRWPSGIRAGVEFSLPTVE